MHRDSFPVQPADELGAAACELRRVSRWAGGRLADATEMVAEEVPVALVYNGISHAVMLATPRDLEAFATGFSLTEGIVQARGEIFDIEIVPACEGIEVQLTVASERMAGLKERRRTLAGRTGCGLCGTESLEQAVRHPPRVPEGTAIHAAAVHAAMGELASLQALHQATGAVHAAAWADLNGHVVLSAEDIGRHNALDKLIGMRARVAQVPAGFAVVTSRASYEMVQKAAAVGITLLAAISAPTALAVRLAEETGLTLIGFARQGDHVIYANGWRLIHS